MQLSRIRWHALAAAACTLGGLGCGSADVSAAPSGDATDGGASSNADATGNDDAPGQTSAAPGTKRGIGYGFPSAADLSALGPTVTWRYNWSDKPDTAATGPGFIPMVWNGNFTTADLEAHVPADAKYILGFNEPNFVHQANMTPAAAAAKWPELQAFAQSHGMKLVSPAVNYCGGAGQCIDTDPFDWLQQFFDACKDCQVDYVGMHWYACDKPALTNTLAKYEKQFGKPLWVTEISCLDDTSKVNAAAELTYLKDAVDALEADPMVFRYAWFTGRATGNDAPVSLLGADGKLTALGTAYAAAPHQ
jgi:hypothetical protein